MRIISTSRSSMALLCVMLLGACAAPGGMGGYSTAGAQAGSVPGSTALNGFGTVQSIDAVAAGEAGLGLGAVTGAVAGGLIGSQVGKGRGNTAATVAGVAGGALAGHQVEKNMRADTPAYRITLRMDNGSLQSIVQANPPAARVGDRVRVINGVIS